MSRLFTLAAAGLFVLGCQEMHEHAHHGEDDEANEVHVKFADAPPAVQSTITQEAGGQNVTTLDQEMHHGKPVYEADAMMNGKNYEIKVAADGTLLSKKLDMEDEAKGKGREKDEKDEK